MKPVATKPFDSNRAWQQASATLRANREVLFALAGVFFLLPSLFAALMFPQPNPPAGTDMNSAMATMMDYSVRTLPVFLPIALFEAGGTLAMLTLMTDRSRPTVGQAIRLGFIALIPYIAAQLLLGLAAGIGAIVLLSVLGLGGAVVATAGLLLLVVLGAWIWVRASLSAPVIAVEGQRSPIAALRRSWQLTRGNGWRVLVFYALLLMVFAILLSIVTALVGTVFALVLSNKAATLASAVVGSALEAGGALVFVAALAATHAQLAGNPDEEVFD